MSAAPILPIDDPQSPRVVSADRTDIWSLAAILAGAWAIRIASALAYPSAHHSDEIFQALEQAHRYAFGLGIKPWEFDVGLRSTILPALLSLVFRASDVVGLPLVPTTRILLASLSLLPVVAIYRAGSRASHLHAVVGAIAAAGWCELVNFSFRPLTEALAANFILTALALVSFHSELSRRTLVLTGLCLGLATMLRIHFAPAALVVVLGLGLFRRPRQFGDVCLGAGIPILAFGLADWIAWGVPFHAPFTALRINILERVASAFGTSPTEAYLDAMAALYGPLGIIAVGVPLVLRASAYRIWILTALAILAAHSLVGHKEYRFTFVVTSMLVVAAAFASADLLRRRWTDWSAAARAMAGGLLIAVTLGVSFASARTTLQSLARGVFEAEQAAFEALSREADLCGLLLDQVAWHMTSAYTTLRRDVPIYQQQGPWRRSPAYNYALTRMPAEAGEGYERIACFKGRQGSPVCLMRRRGPCTPDPALTSLTETRRLGDPRRPD